MEKVRAPGAARAEVDALLAGLSQPPPPEAFEASASKKTPGFLSTRKGLVGFGLVVLSGILQWVAVLSIARMDIWTLRDELMTKALMRWGTVITSGSTFLPALLTLLAHNHGRRGLKELGTAWLALVAMLWLVVGISTLPVFPYNLIPLVPGGLILSGILLMSSKD